jgi:hypothetical protein
MAPILTKECPNCHEESFSARELLGLDYFSATQCKACGAPVRNDGFRQFMMVPAILVVFFAGLVVFSMLPGSLEPFGFLLLLVSVFLTYTWLAKPVTLSYPKIDTPAFTPDPDNDKLIVVKGWGETELQRIVNGFFADGTSGFSARIEIQAIEDSLFRLNFPDDIPFSDFACLVNYLNYPANLELTGRSIVAVGRSTLTADFHGISEPLAGAKAIVYVPESDQDYDVVYVQTEIGTTLMNSFSEGVWRRANEPRLPGEGRRLSSFL